MNHSSKDWTFDHGKPASYEILVQGNLSPNWEGRLGGMKIVNALDTDPSTSTLLAGNVVDQADLMGVLNTLYELHLPVLKVEAMEDPSL